MMLAQQAVKPACAPRHSSHSTDCKHDIAPEGQKRHYPVAFAHPGRCFFDENLSWLPQHIQAVPTSWAFPCGRTLFLLPQQEQAFPHFLDFSLRRKPFLASSAHTSISHFRGDSLWGDHSHYGCPMAKSLGMSRAALTPFAESPARHRLSARQAGRRNSGRIRISCPCARGCTCPRCPHGCPGCCHGRPHRWP